MAITEKVLEGSNQWEIKATGEDLPKLKGMLTQTGNEAYRKAFHHNEGIGFERVTDPSGNLTHVRKDQVEEALANGYGMVGLTPSFVVPELPWQKHRKPMPGRRKYRYNKETRQMEVC